MQATFLFSPPDYGKDIIWDDSANPPEVRGATAEKLVEKLSHETYYGNVVRIHLSTIINKKHFHEFWEHIYINYWLILVECFDCRSNLRDRLPVVIPFFPLSRATDGSVDEEISL